jgi:dihydroorotate dehydrogenase (fumarate)
MGLTLKSPIIAASSDFTSSAESIVKLARAGAGAVVLKSIFEEQILMEIDAQRTNNMFNAYAGVEDYVSYFTQRQALSNYLKLIQQAKEEAGIPVIASVHCSNNETWVKFSKDIEQAGADAIELNIFILPSHKEDNDDTIMARYLDILESVRQHCSLPLAIKVHHYFTGMAYDLTKLAENCDALVLFNRFFNLQINIDTLSVGSGSSFSDPRENAEVQRWIGILRPQVASSLAATTGIHDGAAVVRNLLAGADAVQVASALYSSGPEAIGKMNEFLSDWMITHQFSKIDDFKGKVSYSGIPNPALYERVQFMRYFQGLNR